MLDPRQRLIVALDVSSAAAAQKIVAAVGDSAYCYKVGMQLYTAEGPQLVRDLVASGRRVFLDLKYHDIPNTVAAAVTDAAAAVNPGLMVLAVTVLTSLGDRDLDTLGVHGRVADQVLRLAALAAASGCQGVVASAREASELRTELHGEFAIVTPGVRPAGAG